MSLESTKEYLNRARFRFAKTMKEHPHSWICRKDYVAEEFDEVANFILANGTEKAFYTKKFIYLHLGEYKYWVYRYSRYDKTAIINRAKI